MTCLNPNTTERAEVVFIQFFCFLSASTSAPAPAPASASTTVANNEKKKNSEAALENDTFGLGLATNLAAAVKSNDKMYDLEAEKLKVSKARQEALARLLDI